MIKFIVIICLSLGVASLIAYCIMHVAGFKYKTNSKKLQELDDLLDHLIRRKILEFGIFSKSDKKQKANGYELTERCKTLKVLELIIRGDKNQGNYNNKLIRIYDLLLSIHEKKHNKLKGIKDSIEKYTRVPLASRYLVEKARILLNSDLFMISEEQEKFMNVSEIQQIIAAYTYMSLLIEDAVKGSATVSKVVERVRNVNQKQIFKTVEYMVLLKSGAGSKILMDEIISKQNFEVTKLKKMNETQKHNAIMSIIRSGFKEYKKPQDITSEILDTLKKMNRLRNEHLNSHFKEDQRREEREKKEREERRKREQERFRRQKAHANAEKERRERSRKEQGQRKQKIYAGGVELTDAYQTLGLDPNCSIRKIKKNYKHLAMKKHPDRLSDATASQKQKAHDEFIEIKNAYDKLLKHHKKAA